MQSTKGVGPASPSAGRAETEAQAAVAATNFQAVVPILEQQRAETGTYAGVAVAPGYGVVVVRADAVSYCVQAGAGTTSQHLAGPNGVPAAGPC
jgi:hypothetical protein